MQVIQEFCIKDCSIRFVMPDDKENMYYSPSSELNRFDVIQIIFSSRTKVIKLFDDILQEGIMPFLLILKRLKSEECIPKYLAAGEAGKAYNEFLFGEFDDCSYRNSHKCLVWSDQLVSTFLYDTDNAVCLEIAPNYPWHFVDPEGDERYIHFYVYMKTYKPYVVIELDSDSAQRWIEQCEDLMKEVYKDDV